jgi:hypothetical protein
MSLLGTGAVAMWWDIEPFLKTEFEDWHSHEHFPERMSIPGFRRGSRWADVKGGEGFFVLYELADYETLASPAYLARLNDPTPWSTRMMPHHRNMVRSQCRVSGSFGGGVGRHMLTLRLSPAPDGENALRGKILEKLSALPERPGVTGAHLLETETPKLTQTTEQRIRGGDAVADWILLLSGYDAEVLANIGSDDFGPESFGAEIAGDQRLAAMYRLSYSLAASDLAT